MAESQKSPRLFERIAQRTDRLEVRGSRVHIREYIETPYDEYGIIDKRALFARIMGSVARFDWEGSYEGPHHIMWPRDFYSGKGYGKKHAIPAQFRGCQSLKVILHRDLHDYTHKITEPPELPSIDVMEQYWREQLEVNHLYSLIRHHGLGDFAMTHEQKEAYRQSRFIEELSKVEEGYVGLLPNLEELAAMPFTEARQVIRSLARIQGLSNARSCQSAFFGKADAA